MRPIVARHQRQLPGGKHLGPMRGSLGIGGAADAEIPPARIPIIEGGAAAFKPRHVDVVSSTPEEILNRAAG